MTAAEYFVDVVGAAGDRHAHDAGPFGTPTTHRQRGSVPGVASGEHVVYVRGRDAAGHWGPLSSVLVTGADAGGPDHRSPRC